VTSSNLETRDHIEALWRLTGGAAPVDRLEVSGPAHVFESRYAVTEAAASAVGAASMAAAAILEARGGPAQTVTIDRRHAAAAFAAERLIRRDGAPVEAWAPLSGRYVTADDRSIQLHCNFPHHAEGIARRLGVPLEREAFAEAIRGWRAVDLETALIEDGMVAAAYRTREEWDAHPHALATSALPPLSLERIGDAEVVPLAEAARPLDGVRVLDCSRVLAGPVAGMTLASHGAEVLRVGAEHLPVTESGVLSTGFGKRATHIDLRTAGGRSTFETLLRDADVVIDAFRPDALARLGFGAERLAEVRPGIVVVQLCAFDWTGPWGGRRGFDSIIQSTTGLALPGSDPSEAPSHLPVQALDHATGFLAAFAAMRALGRRQIEGGSWLARLALLRTRNWLVGLGEGGAPEAPPDFEPYMFEVDSAFGRLRAVRPIDALPSSPTRWDRAPEPVGASTPEWL